MIDYGSAESETNWPSSNLYFVAYGLHRDYPLPQIHTPTQADEWYGLSKWGSAHGSRGRVFFAGAESEYKPGRIDTGLDPQYQVDCGLSPADAYDALTTRVQGDTDTHQLLRPLYKTTLPCGG